jgi:hypothetical protein
MQRAALVSVIVLLIGGSMAQASENRCGWILNPTPGNWSLLDRDGEWIMMSQGGYEAPGMDVIGDISAGDYRATNGNYGYACGCLKVDTDGDSSITEIYGFRQLSIAKCEADEALPDPN